MLDVLIVGIGGFLGAASRYTIGSLISERTGSGFPFATLAINITGCFAIGLFMATTPGGLNAHPHARLFIAIGFLGGYTTFSTFGYETLKLVGDGSAMLGFANILGSITLCLTALWLGMFFGRTFA
jgi:CrcB protein